jgi:hypothetical protein
MRRPRTLYRGGLAAAVVVALLIASVVFGGSTAAALPSHAVQVGPQELFVGNFETGNFRQWTQCQNRRYSGSCSGMPAGFYGMQIVQGGAREGQYCARFELRDGDLPRWGGGERAEAARYKNARVREGLERWYEFSLKFDPAFPSEPSGYLMVMQWHGSDRKPPPMAVEVVGDQLVLTGRSPAAPPMVIGDIARNQWVDYVVHAKFGRTTETGWAEVYRNGVLTVPRHARTNMNSKFDYLKVGIYRDSAATSTAGLWLDGVRVTAP